jgi:hypothetical protein
MVPLVPAIPEFLRRNCTVWHYNKRRLQGPTSNVCGKYCCLFALYTPQHFVGLFDAEKADQQIKEPSPQSLARCMAVAAAASAVQVFYKM